MVGRIANTKEDGHALQKRASGSSLSSFSDSYLSSFSESGLSSLPNNKVSYFHLDDYFC